MSTDLTQTVPPDHPTAIEETKIEGATLDPTPDLAEPTQLKLRPGSKRHAQLAGGQGQKQPPAGQVIQQLQMEVASQKLLLQQVVGANQLLSKLLYAFMEKEMAITRVELKGDVAAAIIHIPTGMDLRDDVLENIASFLKLPILVLPHGSTVNGLNEAVMRKNGWIRGGLVDTEGKPL